MISYSNSPLAEREGSEFAADERQDKVTTITGRRLRYYNIFQKYPPSADLIQLSSHSPPQTVSIQIFIVTFTF